MAEVVLTSKEEGWYHWAKQFAQSSRSRIREDFRGKKPGRAEILRAYGAAAQQVGKSGLLIVSAGHGFSRGFTTGAVDLAPYKTLRLSSAHLKHRANLARKADRELVKTYELIGQIIRTNKVPRVLFISCSVGHSWDFLQLIADEWNTTVGGYTDFVEVGYESIKTNKTTVKEYYIFLSTNPPEKAADINYLKRNYPKQAHGNFWWIKPKVAKSSTATKNSATQK